LFEKASLPCTPYELFLNPDEEINDAPEILHPHPLTSNKLESLSYFMTIFQKSIKNTFQRIIDSFYLSFKLHRKL